VHPQRLLCQQNEQCVQSYLTSNNFTIIFFYRTK
jgi:hypothetical protein